MIVFLAAAAASVGDPERVCYDGDAAVKRRVWVEGRGPGFVLDFVKWRVVASKHMIEFEHELSTERRKSGSAGAEVEPAAVVLDRKANNGLRWLVEVDNE